MDILGDYLALKECVSNTVHTDISKLCTALNGFNLDEHEKYFDLYWGCFLITVYQREDKTFYIHQFGVTLYNDLDDEIMENVSIKQIEKAFSISLEGEQS